jgi:hypothetical protein
VQPGFPGGGERGGQFGNKPVEVVAGDAGEDRMSIIQKSIDEVCGHVP